MKNQLIDINAHKENDIMIQKIINDVKLLTCDDQHQMNFH